MRWSLLLSTLIGGVFAGRGFAFRELTNTYANLIHVITEDEQGGLKVDALAAQSGRQAIRKSISLWIPSEDVYSKWNFNYETKASLTTFAHIKKSSAVFSVSGGDMLNPRLVIARLSDTNTDSVAVSGKVDAFDWTVFGIIDLSSGYFGYAYNDSEATCSVTLTRNGRTLESQVQYLPLDPKLGEGTAELKYACTKPKVFSGTIPITNF